MGQSLAGIKIHLVFSTKHREPIILTEDDRALYSYMAKILKDLNCSPKNINGISDHIHILFELNKNLALSKVVEKVKSHSSKWIKTLGDHYTHFKWQTGYGAFSVSRWDVKKITQYIENQKEHHKTQNFQEELVNHLNNENINYDEKYLWD